MTGPESGESPDRQEEWRRRRRLAEVFGEVLPEATSDDRDPAPDKAGGDHDAWLRAQVPPHHGNV